MKSCQSRSGSPPVKAIDRVCLSINGSVFRRSPAKYNALAVFRAGADGYLFEQISRDALIKSLDLVMLGVTILPAALMRLVGEDHEMDSEDDPAVPAAQTEVPTFDHMPRKLSQQETRILRCLMQGEPNKIIARQFDITEATVKVHIKAILRKICVRNRTQAAVWAQSHLTNTVHGLNPVLLGKRGWNAVTFASKAQHRVKGDARTI